MIMELVTGRRGSPHITSQQDRQKHQGIFGDGAYILNTGNMLAPEVQSSNKIHIKDGALMFQGALFTVKVGTYDEVTINNGNQGMKRKDLIVARYTYDSSDNIEAGEWAVIQGTPAADNPVVPEVTSGDIQMGDGVAECPVFVVNLDGINVTGVDIIPETMETIPDLISKLGENYIVEEGSNSNGKYRKWSDGTLEMWHSGNATCAIGTAAGSIYMSSEFTFTFPIASKTACHPVLSIIAQGAIWGSPSSSGNSYRTSFKYHLMAATIWNLASFSFSYYARGTWK